MTIKLWGYIWKYTVDKSQTKGLHHLQHYILPKSMITYQLVITKKINWSELNEPFFPCGHGITLAWGAQKSKPTESSWKLGPGLTYIIHVWSLHIFLFVLSNIFSFLSCLTFSFCLSSFSSCLVCAVCWRPPLGSSEDIWPQILISKKAQNKYREHRNKTNTENSEHRNTGNTEIQGA